MTGAGRAEGWSFFFGWGEAGSRLSCFFRAGLALLEGPVDMHWVSSGLRKSQRRLCCLSQPGLAGGDDSWF